MAKKHTKGQAIDNERAWQKIVKNSAYGLSSNESFIFFDKEVANQITEHGTKTK